MNNTKVVKNTPFGNNILIEKRKKDSLLVQEDDILTEYGEILAIGDEVKKLKVGQIIGYAFFGIIDLKIGDTTYHYIPENANFILSVLELEE